METPFPTALPASTQSSSQKNDAYFVFQASTGLVKSVDMNAVIWLAEFHKGIEKATVRSEWSMNFELLSGLTS